MDYDRIFLKPIPPFLLSWPFWQYLFVQAPTSLSPSLNCDLHKAALGYLRTYSYLIRYPSDFRLAKEHHLIPEDTTSEECCAFFANFQKIPNHMVAPHYAFGELRLGRINFWAKVLPQSLYVPESSDTLWTQCLPITFLRSHDFVVAFFSIVLSAMQVDLTVNPPNDAEASVGWGSFGHICRSFSIFVTVCAVSLVVVLLTLASCMFLRELKFAMYDLLKRRRKEKQSARQSGRSDDSTCRSCCDAEASIGPST